MKTTFRNQCVKLLTQYAYCSPAAVHICTLMTFKQKDARREFCHDSGG
jgi:hypothetical protein